MAIAARLSGLGAVTKQAMCGTVKGGLTATGNSQATALAITEEVNVITTTAASTGVILRSDLGCADDQVVANLGASALSVYPPVGGKINGLATNAAFSVGAGKTARFICTACPTGAATFIAILSA